MKFSMVRLEDRIAPSHGPVQQAIVAGAGGGSKAGPSLIMAQQQLGSGCCWGGGPVQQAILAGAGGKSKAGPSLIMAQQQI